jgi:hypothetical protein
MHNATIDHPLMKKCPKSALGWRFEYGKLTVPQAIRLSEDELERIRKEAVIA